MMLGGHIGARSSMFWAAAYGSPMPFVPYKIRHKDQSFVPIHAVLFIFNNIEAVFLEISVR